jgi:hypothetical protein
VYRLCIASFEPKLIVELTPRTAEEIRNARPLATVLPYDALAHVMLIAAAACAGTEDDRAVS